MRQSVMPAAVRTAFDRIVDYAGLFPPARLPMSEAAAEYERERRGAHAWMLGRFVVPASRISELGSVLEGSTPVPLAVILDAPVPRGEKTQPQICEVAMPIGDPGAMRSAIRAVCKSAASLAPSLPVAVEIPSNTGAISLAEAMGALAERGLSAKIRCGGVTADAVPSVDSVAAFIRAALRARVPFKATAGLHHPVRHFSRETGFVMHGFLNVLAAACFAEDCDSATVVRMLSEEDPTAFSFDERGFAWRDFVAGDAALRDVRENRFRSFGSCSFREPIDDLIHLGVLAAR